MDEYPLDQVGIIDTEWHIKVVCSALRKRGKYLKKQTVSRHGGCAALVDFPDEMYIVDGILNHGYYYNHATKGEWRYHSDYSDGTDSSWRHCLLVKDRRIRCAGVHTSGISTRNLYMDDQGLFCLD